MTTTPKFGIPDISDQQANAETTHNDAVRLLEAMASRAVIDRDLSAPPGSPSDGDTYIVKASGSGDWASQDNKIAVYVTDTWKFITQAEGNSVHLQDENVDVLWNGSAWIALGGFQTLTDASTVAWDAGKGSNAKVQLTTSRTIGAPTNLITGRIYTLQAIQPAEEGESGYTRATITWNVIYNFTGGTAGGTNGASAIDMWTWVYDGTRLQEIGESLNLS